MVTVTVRMLQGAETLPDVASCVQVAAATGLTESRLKLWAAQHRGPLRRARWRNGGAAYRRADVVSFMRSHLGQEYDPPKPPPDDPPPTLEWRRRSMLDGLDADDLTYMLRLMGRRRA